MNYSINKTLIATGLVLALSQVSGPVNAKSADSPQDLRKEVQITTSYALSSILRKDDIKVSVSDAKVTLTGKVSDGVNKELAEQIALGVKGVNNVENNIMIDKNYDSSHSETDSSFGEMIDDATISTRIKSKLLWSKYTDGMDTKVETKGGKVTLKGETQSATTKELVGRMAMNTAGVTKVDNRLVVKATSKDDGASAESAGQAISDSWITAKIKSTYMYSSNVNSSDISVTTDKGEVTLRGTVSSSAERELAMELAKNIRGVNNVNAKELVI